VGGKALVASLGAAVLIAAAVVAMQFFQPSSGPGSLEADRRPQTTVANPPASPTTPALPPTGVRLKDDGGSVTLTWSDPGSGQVSFIVAGGRAGEASRAFETVPPGRTTSTIYGLNDRYDYCFTVAAVWSAEAIVPSIQTCTRRLSTSTPR
jgi:hypothetical protein